MTAIQVCTADPDRPETYQTDLETVREAGTGWSLRDWLIAVPEIAEKASCEEVTLRKVRELALLLRYADLVQGRGRKKIPMDVAASIRLWVENIVQLTTSHTKEDRDRADYASDELLGPVLTAPVAQLREFATGLAAALEADPRIPFYVWGGYKSILENLILKADDKGVIELKTALAREIAERTETALSRGDLVEAIANALKWRAPEDLGKVNDALAAGTKPRITGRQSCLFLEVGEAMVVL